MEALSPLSGNVQRSKATTDKKAKILETANAKAAATRKAEREKHHPSNPPPQLNDDRGRQFAVKELLGAGGFAKVFKGEERYTGKLWALKVVKRDLGHAKMKERVRIGVQIPGSLY
jgi:serine/threonine protein kinase